MRSMATPAIRASSLLKFAMLDLSELYATHFPYGKDYGDLRTLSKVKR